MADLASKSCVPCKGGVPPLTEDEYTEYLEDLDADWQVVDDHHLRKHYDFPDFEQALAFVNRVGEVAEQEGHHPNISFTWGEVELTIWTHKIDGLTMSDFVLAAKADKVLAAD